LLQKDKDPLQNTVTNIIYYTFIFKYAYQLCDVNYVML